MSKKYRKRQADNKRKNSMPKIVGTLLLLVFAAAVIVICFRFGEQSGLRELTASAAPESAAEEASDSGKGTDGAVSAAASDSDSASAAAGSDSAASSVSSRDARIQELLKASSTDDSFWEGCPKRTIDLLTPNEYSRPQEKMETVNRVVIHYTASPGAGAEANREYFESLATTGERHASSHFIVDLDGSILQCIPISEIAYAQVHANYDSISIECCHPDETGKFNEDTFYSAVDLAAFFCMRFSLDPKTQVVRHYDVTGKDCPLYYVEHEDAWQSFLDAVETRYEYLTSESTSAESQGS